MKDDPFGEKVSSEIDQKLSLDELRVLHALVTAPSFSILKKALAIQKQNDMSRLMTASEQVEILRLQGRLQGLNCLEAIPQAMARIYESKVARDKAALERTARDEEQRARFRRGDRS